MGGSKQQAPEPPDVAKASRDGVLADLLTLPGRRQAEIAAATGSVTEIDVPEFDDAGNFSGYTKQTVDFTNASNAALQASQIEQDRVGADAQAKSILDIQGKYGDQFVDQSLDQLRRADPTGFAIRDELGSQIQAQLASGGELTASEQRNVSQNVRSAQAARGNILGVGAATQEVLASDAARRNRQQQNFANASAFLSGATPQQQFGQVGAAQVGAAPFAPVQFNPGSQLNGNAGIAGQNFASNIFNTQAQLFQAQLNQPNPFMQAAGIVGGLGSAALIGRN